jgi:hypothetical protein
MANDTKGLEELQSAELPVFKELSRSCFNRGNGQVDFCRFHPLDPVLACSLDDGRVCIFEGLNHEIPFEEWSRKYWLANAGSWVWRIDWNVSYSNFSNLPQNCSKN